MAQYVSRKHIREGAGDRDRQWRGERERRMERRQRGGGRAYSRLKHRGMQALNAQVTGVLEALPTQHICYRRANVLNSETDS